MFAASRSCTKRGRVLDRTAHSSFARRYRLSYQGENFDTGPNARLSVGEGAPASIEIPEQAVRAGSVLAIAASEAPR